MESNRLEQLNNFLKDSPGDAFIRFAIAKEYEGLGNLEKALTCYEELAGDTPDYVGTYYHLGKAYEIQEQPERAMETYRAGILVAKKQGDRHAANELQGAVEQCEDNI